MPKKPKKVVPAYYAYYDRKSGRILSVTNEKSSKYEYGIEIQYDDYEKLVTGKVKFEDCAIGNVGSSVALELVPAGWQGFKNNLLEQIGAVITPDTEVIVTHCADKWIFQLTDDCKRKAESTGLTGSALFFVILGDDFNFLLRTITISVAELVENTSIVVPFESSRECDLAVVSLATKVLFNSYGVVDECD